MATLAYGYSYEITLLSNEYQHDRVKMVFKNLRILIFWATLALALEGLRASLVVEAMLHHIIFIVIGSMTTLWKSGTISRGSLPNFWTCLLVTMRQGMLSMLALHNAGIDGK